MVELLKRLEPRFCLPGDFIFIENEEVNEQIYVIEGVYMVGCTINTRVRYHIKLRKKSIVGGYENMKGYTSNYAYKALEHVRGYSLRKTVMIPLMNEKCYSEFRDHILSFFIRFYRYLI